MSDGEKTEERIQDKESLWEGLICIIRISKVKERNWAEAIFKEIVAGNFQKLLKDKSRIQESLQTPSRSNKRKTRPRHIRVKQFKHLQRIDRKITANLESYTQWKYSLKMKAKSKLFQPRIDEFVVKEILESVLYTGGKWSQMEIRDVERNNEQCKV